MIKHWLREWLGINRDINALHTKIERETEYRQALKRRLERERQAQIRRASRPYDDAL
jgi:hypothetical protein